MKERYPAQIEESTIAGVPTRVFNPSDVDEGRLPESRDAFQIIADFFDEHLGR